jgi:hypothetical protein
MIKKTKLLDEGRVTDKLDELIKYYEELMEDLPTKKEFKEERLVRRGIDRR